MKGIAYCHLIKQDLRNLFVNLMTVSQLHRLHNISERMFVKAVEGNSHGLL